MRSWRTTLDIALVLALLVVGVLTYPWAQREYYFWLLGSPNPEQAADARDALVRVGGDAVPGLIDHVRREAPHPAARVLAFEALTRIEDPRVVPLILEVARSDWDQELQSQALQVLASARVPEARPIFAELADHPDPRIRYDAVRGLAAAGGPRAIPLLVDRLTDDEFLVAATAATALGQISGQPTAFPRGDDAESQAARANTIAAWEQRLQVLGDPGQLTRTERKTAGVPGSEGIQAPEAPDFALQTLDGRTIRLRDLRGTPVLLNFWASWCTPCINETADLVETAAALGDDAVVLGIAAEHKNSVPAERELQRRGVAVTEAAITELQTQAVRRFVAEHGIAYPIALGDTAVLDAYNAYALPTTVVVRPDGTIHRRIIGERTKDYFVRVLRDAAKA